MLRTPVCEEHLHRNEPHSPHVRFGLRVTTSRGRRPGPSQGSASWPPAAEPSGHVVTQATAITIVRTVPLVTGGSGARSRFRSARSSPWSAGRAAQSPLGPRVASGRRDSRDEVPSEWPPRTARAGWTWQQGQFRGAPGVGATLPESEERCVVAGGLPGVDAGDDRPGIGPRSCGSSECPAGAGGFDLRSVKIGCGRRPGRQRPSTSCCQALPGPEPAQG